MTTPRLRPVTWRSATTGRPSPPGSTWPCSPARSSPSSAQRQRQVDAAGHHRRRRAALGRVGSSSTASTSRVCPSTARGIGLIFQEPLLFPHLSVADNVAYGLRRHGVARAAARDQAGELCSTGSDSAATGLAPVDELSGGQAQRVALARALAPRARPSCFSTSRSAPSTRTCGSDSPPTSPPCCASTACRRGACDPRPERGRGHRRPRGHDGGPRRVSGLVRSPTSTRATTGAAWSDPAGRSARDHAAPPACRGAVGRGRPRSPARSSPPGGWVRPARSAGSGATSTSRRRLRRRARPRPSTLSSSPNPDLGYPVRAGPRRASRHPTCINVLELKVLALVTGDPAVAVNSYLVLSLRADRGRRLRAAARRPHRPAPARPPSASRSVSSRGTSSASPTPASPTTPPSPSA